MHQLLRRHETSVDVMFHAARNNNDVTHKQCESYIINFEVARLEEEANDTERVIAVVKSERSRRSPDN